MRAPRPSLLLVALVAAVAGRLPAQLQPLTVPRGTLRLDLLGRFESFDRRWNDGVREEWLGDVDGRRFDRSVVPGLEAAEARLADLTGLGDVALSLGTARATQLVNLGTMGVGGAFGVNRWLTVFGTVPFVRVAAKTRLALDGEGGNAGLNPADPVFGSAAGQADAAAFFAAFTQATATLQNRLANGDYDADPSLRALAQQTAAEATALAAGLFDLLSGPGTASPFLPRAGTPVAAALLQRVQQLQATLAGPLGVAGFTALPPLPAGPATTDDLLGYVTGPEGPIAARPFDDVPDLTYLGDVEVGAVVALVDRFPASSYGRGIRAAVEATLRLPTARLDEPDRFFDLGTGDGQTDVEVGLTADAALGRFGARLSAGYNLQLEGSLDRRVAPPGQLAPASTLASLRRNPGDVLRLGARPFVRLAPFLALSASVDYWRRGEDRYAYAADQAPVSGADLGQLALGSRAEAVVLGGALSFAHTGLDRRRAQRLPLDASVRYERVASSATGRVAAAHVVRVDLRFYTGLFK